MGKYLCIPKTAGGPHDSKATLQPLNDYIAFGCIYSHILLNLSMVRFIYYLKIQLLHYIFQIAVILFYSESRAKVLLQRFLYLNYTINSQVLAGILIMSKERRFIGKFVNCVYGILLGFGFSNVVKDIIDTVKEEEQLIIWLMIRIPWFVGNITMSVFIVVVVCLYWWDWSENIETKVQSTFVEFTIDILILFTLEFLFFLFEYPKGVSILFIILSILNLIWVFNYLWNEHKNNSDTKNYLRNLSDWKYILQKIYSIINYSVCLFLICIIYCCFEKDCDIAYFLSTGFLIMFFIINRYISFMRRPL